MVQRTFADLVKDLRMRRTVGDPPPVLLLGAGASVDAGIGAMHDLFAFLGCADFDEFSRYIRQTTAAERYRYLSEFLQTRTPGEITPGYQALAALCAQNYFDIVLTTNMDPLLDDALAAARLWRRDYLLMVNGVIRPERLELLLRAQSPRVKVVKLHGDLFQRYMAWTIEEMDTFMEEISPFLAPAIAGRDILVVGYSLRDARVRALVEGLGGSIWFTHPQRVPDHLADSRSMRAVVAPECAFEAFFPALASSLGVEVQTPRMRAGVAAARPSAAEGAQTLDDVLSSVLAVAGVNGVPSATAFLLENPRVVVCDSFATAPHISAAGEITLIGRGDRRYKARILGSNQAHPFGPTLAAAPASLPARGLRLDPAALQRDDALQAAVAAGERTGVSAGVVTHTRLGVIEVPPIGPVPDLVSMECLVRPGASGAPVFDDRMAVRGFIVAGSSDERRPVSMVYPASKWAGFLERATRTRRTSRPRASRR